MLVIKQLDDLKKLSAYYSPLDANKKYYYNLYVEAGGEKPFEEYETEDVLELIANADSAGSTYHFDLNEDNTIRWYSAKSGGGYQIDQAHGQFLRLFSDAGTSVYIHYAQVYQPVDYVRENIDIMSLVLAVTYSNAAYNLACMEDYIRDAEIISAKLQELNRDYQKLTMLRSGSPTQASTDYCAVDSSFIKELLAAGFLKESDVFCTSVSITPIYVEFEIYTTHWVKYCNWISFTPDGETYYLKEDPFKALGAWVDSNKDYDKDIYGNRHNHDWEGYPEDLPSAPKDFQPQFVSPNSQDVTHLLSCEGHNITIPITPIGVDLIRGPVCFYHTTLREDGQYYPDDDYFSKYKSSEYVWEDKKEVDIDVSFPAKSYAKQDTVEDIIAGNMYAYMSGRDLDSYLDIIREQIDTLNNQLQIPTTYISLESNDLSTCFDTATNILSNVGTQLQTITRNTRI